MQFKNPWELQLERGYNLQISIGPEGADEELRGCPFTLEVRGLEALILKFDVARIGT